MFTMADAKAPSDAYKRLDSDAEAAQPLNPEKAKAVNHEGSSGVRDYEKDGGEEDKIPSFYPAYHLGCVV